VEGNNEERAATPPPEERSFVDDDGTAYQWDPAQRRFAELGAPAAPSYGVEEMTFAVEPEVIPAMPRKEARPHCHLHHVQRSTRHDTPKPSSPLSMHQSALWSSNWALSFCANGAGM